MKVIDIWELRNGKFVQILEDMTTSAGWYKFKVEVDRDILEEFPD